MTRPTKTLYYAISPCQSIITKIFRLHPYCCPGVSDVTTLNSGEIKPTPEFGSTLDTQYLLGLGTVNERMLILVDIEKLMSGADMALVDQTTLQ